MDTQKLMNSYKERSEKENRLRPKHGSKIFSSMKRFFSGSQANVASRTTNENGGNITSELEMSSITPVNANSSKYGDNNSSYFKAPMKGVRSRSEQTPNQLLSSFFQEKGDQPLTEVEMEGVMSLLEKSRDISQSEISLQNVNMTLPHTENLDKFNPTSSRILSNSQFGTPRVQKMLRSSSASNRSFSTPEYHASYYPADKSFSSNPSVRRVYRFSGIPSPYRTRIKVPVTHQPSNVPRPSESALLDGSEAGQMNIRKSNLSGTATSILSILDDTETKNEKVKGEASKLNELGTLGNPYTRGNKLKHNLRSSTAEGPSKKQAKLVLSAEDISKTASFSQAEVIDEIPQATESLPEPNEKLIAEKDKHKHKIFESAEKSSTENLDLSSATAETSSHSKNGSEGFQRSLLNNIFDVSSADKFPENKLPQTTMAQEDKISKCLHNANYEFPSINLISVELDSKAVSDYKGIFKF